MTDRAGPQLIEPPSARVTAGRGDAAGPIRTKGRGRERRIPGEEGTWVFILGDLTVFAVMFAVFLYYRGQDPALFGASQQRLAQGYGVVNTLILLSSSLLVVMAMQAIRNRTFRSAQRLLLAASGCGVGFAGVKYFEYGEKLDRGIGPTTNDFWMYYFTLTGVHLLHVLVGIGMLVSAAVLIRRGRPTPKQLMLVEGGTCFWHMVDLLWIVLFALLYLVH